ncbi:MAG: hypothetical protein AseanaTS_08230 [Candidatus Pelagadaptatus aseana]|uniref:c-type cytochrome n=1 Tax=Candidatus Pelagadaptatus aseana TaxID=3120508 RepID=UPI0039B1AE43
MTFKYYVSTWVAAAASSVAAAVLWVATAVLWIAPAYAADPVAGEALYQSCVACHGDQAQGNDALGAPALAGQQAPYIARQIQAYQSGLRGSEDHYAAQMPALVETLSDADTANVAAYVSSLAPVKTPLADGDLRKGNNYYHASCGGCHGGKAEGNDMLQAPRLAGLSAAYLKRQFNHFKSGARGTDDTDRLGRQMNMMAQVLPDEATLDAVIAYITAQAQ